ncbi:MAG: methionyl-tRNA formyltransferase, partial [Myxococcota bacterium]
PVAHAILAGDAITGVSLMQMDEGLDTGPVFAKATTPIEATDTTETLTARLAGIGAEFTVEQLPAILAGRLSATPQLDVDASYAPLLKKQDGLLNFEESAAVLERKVRAYQPWPMAAFGDGEARIQVGAAAASDGSGEPGTVLETGKLGVRVGCGEGSLWLVEVKPPGKRMMPGAAWVAGRRVKAGDRLSG